MFVVLISLLIVTFLSLISRVLSLMQTTKEVNPHPCNAPCANMWSATFLFLLLFFFCHLLIVDAWYATSPKKTKWNGPHHTIKMLHFVLFHSVTCYTNSITSRIHANTTKLYNIMCTLVATCVILRSLECSSFTTKSGIRIQGGLSLRVSWNNGFDTTCILLSFFKCDATTWQIKSNLNM